MSDGHGKPPHPGRLFFFDHNGRIFNKKHEIPAIVPAAEQLIVWHFVEYAPKRCNYAGKPQPHIPLEPTRTGRCSRGGAGAQRSRKLTSDF